MHRCVGIIHTPHTIINVIVLEGSRQLLNELLGALWRPIAATEKPGKRISDIVAASLPIKV